MSGDHFHFFAQPWWVNLLVLVPLIFLFTTRKNRLGLETGQLFSTGLFAIAFGYVEAAVVVYIRASLGLLPGYHGTLAEVRRLAADVYRQPIMEVQMPAALARVEVVREAATMVMLMSVAIAAARGGRQRWAIFLWCFAVWDITYYAGLWATIGWPYSLLAPDILFLIPVPWVSQVWYPLVVSGMTMIAVLVGNGRKASSVA